MNSAIPSLDIMIHPLTGSFDEPTSRSSATDQSPESGKHESVINSKQYFKT